MPRSILLVCCLAAWIPWAGLAAEEFRIFTQPQMIPERGPVVSYTILTESNRFRFVPPERWSARVDEAERTIIFRSADLISGLAVKWHAGLTTNSLPLSASTNLLRNFTENNNAGATIIREFPTYVKTGRVQGFDLEQITTGERKLATRLVYVPYTHGTVEFKMILPAHLLDSQQRVLGSMLSTFAVD